MLLRQRIPTVSVAVTRHGNSLPVGLNIGNLCIFQKAIETLICSQKPMESHELNIVMTILFFTRLYLEDEHSAAKET